MLVVAVAVFAAAWIAVASRGSSATPPAKPGLAQPGTALRRRRRPDAAPRAPQARREAEVTGLSRGELLRRGLVALAAGNVYSLVDGLTAAPARAALTAALRPEQYLIGGLRVVNELGIDVILPPLHHRVVTARVRVAGPRSWSRRRPGSNTLWSPSNGAIPPPPAGLGVTVSWGLPYFRRLVPKLADGRRYPATCRSTEARRRRSASTSQPCSTRPASRATAADVILGGDDVVFLFRSDNAAHIDDGYHALLESLGDLFAVRSVRNGFGGGGFAPGPGLAKQMALAAGIPGADLIVDGVQMFLGFTSTQKAAMAPDRIASFETLRGLTDQTPQSYWSGGAAMHLSHLNEDLERWWSEAPFTDQLRAMTRPGLSVPDKTYTIAEDISRVERAADVHSDLARFGAVGHSATLQTVSRLRADTRDAYGVVRPRGTAIIQRADFNTLDNPFASSAVAAETRRHRRPDCISSRSRRPPTCSTARGARWTARSATGRRCRSTRARRRSGSTRSSTPRTGRTSSRRPARIARSRSSSCSGNARDLDGAAPGQRVLALVRGAVALVRLRRLRAVERRRIVVSGTGVGGTDRDRQRAALLELGQFRPRDRDVSRELVVAHVQPTADADRHSHGSGGDREDERLRRHPCDATGTRRRTATRALEQEVWSTQPGGAWLRSSPHASFTSVPWTVEPSIVDGPPTGRLPRRNAFQVRAPAHRRAHVDVLGRVADAAVLDVLQVVELVLGARAGERHGVRRSRRGDSGGAERRLRRKAQNDPAHRLF